CFIPRKHRRRLGISVKVLYQCHNLATAFALF
ncbi:hypothetical protein chiPu_0013546, partial [Chiloscyllium punctatum]|nr:hypothetical protein [Chiloscyllium punctatum]